MSAFGYAMTQGGANLITGTISSLINAGIGEITAGQQHKRNKELMDYQSSLARDQYNYERAMESPTQIAKDYERAGMNPALAMTGGATSPGMTASVSPSQAVSGSTPFHGSSLQAGNIAELKRVEAQNERDRQQALRDSVESAYKRYELEVLAPIQAKLETRRAEHIAQETENLKTAKDNLELENQMKAIDARYHEFSVKLNNLVKQTTAAFNVASAAKLNKELEAIASEIRKDESLMELYGAQVNELIARTNSYNYDNALKAAQEGYYKSANTKLRKEADKLVAETELTEEKKRELTNLIALRWAQYGVDAAEKTSSEIREWLYGWIPFRQGKAKLDTYVTENWHKMY